MSFHCWARKGSDVPLHLEARNYRDFAGAKPYRAQLTTLIKDIRSRKGGVPLKEEYRVTYVTAPPLPRNYVARSDALASLRAILITDGGGQASR